MTDDIDYYDDNNSDSGPVGKLTGLFAERAENAKKLLDQSEDDLNVIVKDLSERSSKTLTDGYVDLANVRSSLLGPTVSLLSDSQSVFGKIGQKIVRQSQNAISDAYAAYQAMGSSPPVLFSTVKQELDEGYPYVSGVQRIIGVVADDPRIPPLPPEDPNCGTESLLPQGFAPQIGDCPGGGTIENEPLPDKELCRLYGIKCPPEDPGGDKPPPYPPPPPPPGGDDCSKDCSTVPVCPTPVINVYCKDTCDEKEPTEEECHEETVCNDLYLYRVSNQPSGWTIISKEQYEERMQYYTGGTVYQEGYILVTPLGGDLFYQELGFQAGADCKTTTVCTPVDKKKDKKKPGETDKKDPGDDDFPRPTPLPIPPPKTYEIGHTWDTPDACVDSGIGLESALKDISNSAENLTDNVITSAFEKLPQIPSLPFPIGRILQFGTDVITSVPKAVGAAAIEFAQSAATNLQFAQVANTGIFFEASGLLSVFGFAKQWLGVDLQPIETTVKYFQNYSFPSQLPSQSDLDRLYLTSYITDSTWECWTKAIGNLPNSHRMVRDSAQTRLNISELVDLWYRGYIQDADLEHQSRRRGVQELYNVEAWKKLKEVIPPMTDIIRMMVRDVENPEVVIEDGLDVGFDQNYKDTLKYWGHAQGITAEVAKYYWRAHWQEISPTQAYEMYRRLRPGRVDTDLQFDRERLVRQLKQSDYPPGLVDRLVEISYNPITRTDAIKGYYAGSIDERELWERFQDVGYSPDDAELLVKILSDDRKRRTINQTGQWTPRRIAREYREGSINRQSAENLLGYYYKDKEIIAAALDAAEEIRDAETKKSCIKGVRRRYMVGELSYWEAIDLLKEIGVFSPQSNTLVNRWVCDLNSKRKEPTVGYLLDWTKRKIISVTQLYQRLINLGYSDTDANNIINAAEHKWDEENKKAAIAESRRKDRVARARCGARKGGCDVEGDKTIGIDQG